MEIVVLFVCLFLKNNNRKTRVLFNFHVLAAFIKRVLVAKI